MIITDYSSIYFDFAYMRKSVIYYQFDQDLFFSNHYLKGYFEVGRDGFGPLCTTEACVIANCKEIIDQDFKPDSLYLQRMKNFFSLYDTKNCERIFTAISNL